MAKQVAVWMIRAYRRVSALTPAVCRFTPTCSRYAEEAIQKYGFWKGSWMGLKRLARCHPFTPGGYDPVP